MRARWPSTHRGSSSLPKHRSGHAFERRDEISSTPSGLVNDYHIASWPCEHFKGGSSVVPRSLCLLRVSSCSKGKNAEGPFPTQLSRLFTTPGRSVRGHEYLLPPPRLSAGYRLREGTFA